ncbi:hypothetical protein D3C81_1964830 [compost metagenome]
MQEHGEVAAHGLVALRFHLRLRGAHHHPVAVAGGLLQQAVAYGAADKIDLHAPMMPQWARAMRTAGQRPALAGCSGRRVAQSPPLSALAAQAKFLRLACRRPFMRSVTGSALPFKRQS